MANIWRPKEERFNQILRRKEQELTDFSYPSTEPDIPVWTRPGLEMRAYEPKTFVQRMQDEILKARQSPPQNLDLGGLKTLGLKAVGDVAGVLTGEGTGIMPAAGSAMKPLQIGARDMLQLRAGTPKVIRLKSSYPAKPVLASFEQKALGHNIAKEKGLLDYKGHGRQDYKRLAQAITGKNTMAKMDTYEANAFIDALERVPVRNGKPITKIISGEIPKEFADVVPMVKEINIIDRIRQAPVVFQKMHPYLRKVIYEPAEDAAVKIYEQKTAFYGEMNRMNQLIGKNPESKQRIFDALENPIETHLLDAKEGEAYLWFRKFFDDWADKLKLPENQRRQNYVTHIFEESIQKALKDKKMLDVELIRAMDFSTPKKVFNPYIKQRLGREIGLVEDPFRAAEAYEGYALKQFHYEPLIQKMRVYEQYLPPNDANYLREYIKRIVGRPDRLDREMNTALRDFAGTMKKYPGGEKLAELFGFERGNAAGLLAYNVTSLFYQAFLGLRPAAAIRNLSQNVLTVAETNPLNFAEGVGLRLTQEGKTALSQSKMMKMRNVAFMPGLEEPFIKSLPKKLQDSSMAMFKWADKDNMTNAFLSGYAEAKRLGLPKEWAIKRGDEVGAQTQFIYSKMAQSLFEQSALGKSIAMFTSYPRNFLELMWKWGSGKKSLVYEEYAKQTGKKVLSDDPLAKRKELLTFLAIVGAAYAAEKNSPIKFTEYTGWTTFNQLANTISGDIPLTSTLGGWARIVGGALTGDMKQIKQGWSDVRPDRMLMFVRQLEDIASGKSDWLSLFVYLNKKVAEKSPRIRVK